MLGGSLANGLLLVIPVDQHFGGFVHVGRIIVVLNGVTVVVVDWVRVIGSIQNGMFLHRHLHHGGILGGGHVFTIEGEIFSGTQGRVLRTLSVVVIKRDTKVKRNGLLHCVGGMGGGMG